jgi:hypothetical protein
MRATIIGLFVSVVLCAGSASAYDPYDPNNCNGADGWDNTLAFAVSKVTAQPRVYFVKSPYDDDFKAATCPAATETCRKNSYLVIGDLVLAGRTQGDFTCVTYQSPTAKKHIWTNGWLPSAALTPVAPIASPKAVDWVGNWSQPNGSIEIRRGIGGKLRIQGEMVVPTAHDAHTGAIEAAVMPEKDSIAFVDDGSIPFDKADEGECRVRMQRIGPWLVVVDNGGCGGAGVTFTGFYRRKS